MRLFFCGDIVGRSGREALAKYLPKIRADFPLDAVIVDADNAAGGIGVNPGICKELFALGVDVITGGDHIWDQKEIIPYMEREPRLLRALNFPDISIPGKGHILIETRHGKKLLVTMLMGQVFMKHVMDNPFIAIEKLLTHYRLGQECDAIFVDMHAEATSEKMAMGQFLDGKVSAVIGAHTHVPTSDAVILNNGTAYQTDAGMSGDYDSIIGQKLEGPMQMFYYRTHRIHSKVASKEGTLCGTLIEIDENTGLASTIYPIQLGGRLATLYPKS